jgi:SPP1 gp7 family putative phage head morphogenesis protein
MMLLKPVPQKEAADFIKSKPAVTRAVFDELLPELKARAFTVSGIESANVLQDLRDRIADLPLGGDWDKIKADLVEQISPFLASGGDDEEAQKKTAAKATRRAELLLRLHGFQAYAASAYRVMDRQRDVFPFWMYRSMGDGKVRDSHAALNGKILPSTSPFWQKHYPPWEWACRCQVVPMMQGDVDEIREAEKDRPLEERRVLEGAALESVEQRGSLVAGPNKVFDLRTPSEKGQPGGFEWSPGDLTLTPDQLRDRYSPEVWTKFETWAKAARISKNLTVWQWMNRSTPAPKDEIPASLAAMTKVKDLDASRDSRIWKLAKEKVLMPGASWSFGILLEYLKAEAKRTLGLP